MNYMPIQKWFRISKWNILAVDNIPINAAIYLNENDIAKQNPNLLEWNNNQSGECDSYYRPTKSN